MCRVKNIHILRIFLSLLVLLLAYITCSDNLLSLLLLKNIYYIYKFDKSRAYLGPVLSEMAQLLIELEWWHSMLRSIQIMCFQAIFFKFGECCNLVTCTWRRMSSCQHTVFGAFIGIALRLIWRGWLFFCRHFQIGAGWMAWQFAARCGRTQKSLGGRRFLYFWFGHFMFLFKHDRLVRFVTTKCLNRFEGEKLELRILDMRNNNKNRINWW